MLSGFERGLGHREVQPGRSGDDNRVDFGVVDKFGEIGLAIHFRIERTHLFQTLLTEVAYDLQTALWDRAKVSHEVGSPVAIADNPDGEVLFHFRR